MRDLIFIGVTQQDRDSFPSHVHSTWEIHYYFSGEGRTVVGDEEYRFGPGTILFLPPDIPHSEFSVNGYRNIWFSVNYLRSELFNREGSASSKVLSFEDNQNRDIYNLLLQINREFFLRRHNWRNIVESLLDAVTEYLISRNVEERTNPLVEQLKEILVGNINTKGFQVSDAMKGIPLSPDHLRRLFKR